MTECAAALRTLVVLLVVGAVVALPSPIAAAGPKEFKLVLKWTPKEAPDLPTLDLTGGLYSLELPTFADAREKPTEIGENAEKETVVTTTSDVPTFVHGILKTELKAHGLELKDAGADRVLKGELLHFWVRDSGSYSATVRVKFTLMNGASEVWVGIVQGTGENWGRSLKAINFTETISGAISELMAKLLQTPELKAALRKSKPS